MRALLLRVLRGLLWLVALPSVAAPGLVGSYFGNTTLTAPAQLVRTDSTVNFNWGTGAPGGSVGVDNFSVRWTGYVRAATTGTYTFQTLSDDGVRLTVGGTTVINNWTSHSASYDTSGGITLTAGVDYPLTLEFYEAGINAQVQLLWKKPGDFGFSTIPASNGALGLSTALAPMLQYRFDEPDWNGTAGEVLDSSGNGWNATAASLSSTKPTTAATTPAIAGATGTCGYGVFKRANKDYLALPTSFPRLGTSGSFTVTAWIRSSDSTQAGQRVLVDDESNAGGYGLSLGDGGAGMLRFYTRFAGVDYIIDSAAVVTSNTWVFVAASFDSSTRTRKLSVYSSAGTLLSTVSDTIAQAGFVAATGTASLGGETNSAVNAYGGSEATPNFGFGGFIDSVRVYPFVLTGTELATVRTLVSTCPVVSLLAEYHFEEAGWAGSAGELKDSAGHGGGPYNGKAQGSPQPAIASAAPARPGTVGTCGYASLPGPASNGGSFIVGGLPVSTSAGAQTSVAFWMYWTGADPSILVSFNTYALGIGGGMLGFDTNGSDIYGASAAGLANGWHHVVAVFTNGSLAGNRLYIDGVQKTLSQYGTPTMAYATVSSALGIGASPVTTGYRFSGRLDELRVYNGALGSTEVATLYAQTHACASGLDHLELRMGSASGLTCAPATVTVAACADTACATPYTGGVSGTLTATGSGMTVLWPTGAGFSIASGSSSTTESMHLTTAGSVLVGASGLAPAAASATSCNFGSPTCTFTAAASGFEFDVPDHAAGTVNNVNVSAKSSSGASCASAFSGTQVVSFKCSYTNPASGSLPVTVAGTGSATALNAAGNAGAACDGSGHSVNLLFNASGVAPISVQYADVGRMQLSASYTSGGLTMTGSDSFIAAPDKFDVTVTTATPIKAGEVFSATVTARNRNNALTPNFGSETVAESATLAFTKVQPTGGGASDGVFNGSLGAFAGGSVSAGSLSWSEVGTGQLTATLASGSYLGSGLGATGSSATIDRFIPHHFDLTLTAACGSFSYAGQPFTATVRARNVDGDTTLNYDGSAATSPNFAKVVTLSRLSAPGAGTLGGSTLAVGAFSAGVASASPSYGFTDKLTLPGTLALRATDTDGVSSSGFTEGSMALRSGRLRLSNAFGSAGTALQVPVVAEYWSSSGKAWVLNSADSCTALAAASVALSNGRSAAGSASAATSTASALSLSSGSGTITLSAPTPAGSSLTLDLALNLGSTGTDQSCQSMHPPSTGAAKPWLRALNGNCAATEDRDPAARASFGIFSPETRKTVHVREIF